MPMEPLYLTSTFLPDLKQPKNTGTEQVQAIVKHWILGSLDRRISANSKDTAQAGNKQTQTGKLKTSRLLTSDIQERTSERRLHTGQMYLDSAQL
ncbi:hypothetical protein Y1Q_0002255 [Alligator mississippiensis]|uniref:Uncharacterized protein n=1 Tax=Alligator mississippiensis TaxID=8496 RepID=A0A151MGG7_ALLMI|nr:hypothetical protein Y1Q_0002255 [Alligator mississippiensis]